MPIGRNLDDPRKFWRKGTRDAPGGELGSDIAVNAVGSLIAGWKVNASVTHRNLMTNQAENRWQNHQISQEES